MRELKRVLRHLAVLNIVYVNPNLKINRPADSVISGADIVEVAPPFDHGVLSYPLTSYGLSSTRFRLGSHPAEVTTVMAAKLARDLLYLLRGDTIPPTLPDVFVRDEL